IVKFGTLGNCAARTSGVGTVQRVIDLALTGVQLQLGPPADGSFVHGKEWREHQFLIHPLDALTRPLFQEIYFLTEGLTDKSVWPDVSAKDGPAMEISCLALLERGREIGDARAQRNNGKLLRAQLAPSVHITLRKVRILEQAPEPGVLPIIELGPVPSFGVDAIARVG